MNGQVFAKYPYFKTVESGLSTEANDKSGKWLEK